MSEIRLVTPEEFDAVINVSANAYPGLKLHTPEARERIKSHLQLIHDQVPVIHNYGLFREGQLVGSMRLFDFQMNCFNVQLPAGGIGFVAVDLLHKKEHVAKEMLSFFVRHYREAGAPLALLYPFRPDFYHAMGFGYATKMNQYRVRPASLPHNGSREHLRPLTRGDMEALADCYNRLQARTHGLILRYLPEWETWFTNPESQLVGYLRDGKVEGYLSFGFKKLSETNALRNSIVVHELAYEHPQALEALLTFLHTQADQIDFVVFNTQDENLHYLFHDPRNGNDPMIPPVCHESNLQGVGLMVRVVNIPGLFTALREHDFGGQTCRLRLTVRDTFLPENDGSFRIDFDQGTATLSDEGEPEVEITLNIAEFSALVLGAVDFRSLYNYGLARISDPHYLPVVNRLFAVEEKPICWTGF